MDTNGKDSGKNWTVYRERANVLVESLGVGRRYRGHDMLTEAVCMALSDKESLMAFKKRVLIPIGELHGCDWRCVERNLRTVVRRVWQQSAERLHSISPYHLVCMPSAVEFVDILSMYLYRCQRKSDGLRGRRESTSSQSEEAVAPRAGTQTQQES